MSNLNQAIALMKETDQISGKQTVWEHGISVRDHLLDLIKVLTNPEHQSTINWQIPDSFKSINWNTYLYDLPSLSRYGLFHDIGKPLVRCKDDKG